MKELILKFWNSIVKIENTGFSDISNQLFCTDYYSELELPIIFYVSAGSSENENKKL